MDADALIGLLSALGGLTRSSLRQFYGTMIHFPGMGLDLELRFECC